MVEGTVYTKHICQPNPNCCDYKPVVLRLAGLETCMRSTVLPPVARLAMTSRFTSSLAIYSSSKWFFVFA